jgi:UDP-glucose 4-epimerase
LLRIAEMSILITGSSGYFGRLVAGDLISAGRRVAGIDIKADPGMTEGEPFRFYSCSVTDRESLGRIFQEVRPTVVMHFACSFNKVRSRRKEYEIDVAGSRNVMELCNETLSVRKLIYSSSAAIYGASRNNGTWLGETAEVNPGKYRYGINKKLIEHDLFTFRKRDDLRVISLRICTVVGPDYCKPRSVVSILLCLPFLPGSFRDKRVQFLHEADFVSLIRKVADDPDIEGIYNLAADSYSVVGEMLPGKRYVDFPVHALKPILWVLWNLRILNLQPCSLVYSLYPILVDPSKIRSRYIYSYSYTSSEALADTMKNNKLPAGTMF